MVNNHVLCFSTWERTVCMIVCLDVCRLLSLCVCVCVYISASGRTTAEEKTFKRYNLTWVSPLILFWHSDLWTTQNIKLLISSYHWHVKGNLICNTCFWTRHVKLVLKVTMFAILWTWFHLVLVIEKDS